jgi:hypothetical protein
MTTIQCKEIAKTVRKELKAAYPSIKFSVKSDFNKISVSYTDGVRASEIEPFLNKYRGYRDLDTYGDYGADTTAQDVEFNGETVGTYLNYINVSRSFSEAYITEVLDYVKSTLNGAESDGVAVEISEWSGTAHFTGHSHDNYGYYCEIARESSSLESIKVQRDRKDAEEEEKLNIWIAERAAKELETKKEVQEVTITPLEIITIQSGAVELIESVFPKLNKNDTLEEYTEQLEAEHFDKVKASVTKVIKLTDSDYDLFTNNLLTSFDWLDGEGGTDSTANLPDVESFYKYSEADQKYWKSEAYTLCVLVYASDRDAILVDPQGYTYARYVGFMDQQVAAKYLPKQIKATKKLSLSFTKNSDIDFTIHSANIEVIQVQEAEAIAPLPQPIAIAQPIQEIGVSQPIPQIVPRGKTSYIYSHKDLGEYSFQVWEFSDKVGVYYSGSGGLFWVSFGAAVNHSEELISKNWKLTKSITNGEVTNYPHFEAEQAIAQPIQSESVSDLLYDANKIAVRNIGLHTITPPTAGQAITDNISDGAILSVNPVVDETAIVSGATPNLTRLNPAIMAVEGCQRNEFITGKLENKAPTFSSLPIDAIDFSSSRIPLRSGASDVPFASADMPPTLIEFPTQEVISALDNNLPASLASTSPLSSCTTPTGSLVEYSHNPEFSSSQVVECVEHEQSIPLSSEPTIEDKIAQVLEDRRSVFGDKKDRKLTAYTRLIKKHQSLADSHYRAFRSTADMIPLGQPILVGHYSEKRHRRDIKRMRSNMDKSCESANTAKHYEGKIHTLESSHVINSADPDVLVKLEEKLAGLESKHQNMKACNKIIKSKKLIDDQKIEELHSIGIHRRLGTELLKPDFCGRIGYADYQLANSNANMKTVRDRIASIKATLIKAIESPEVAYPELGLKVLRNTEVNRLQLVFDGKPDQSVRSLLKSNGFKWAPSQGAWQRDLNNNGTHAANRVIGKLKNDLPVSDQVLEVADQNLEVEAIASLPFQGVENLAISLSPFPQTTEAIAEPIQPEITEPEEAIAPLPDQESQLEAIDNQIKDLDSKWREEIRRSNFCWKRPSEAHKKRLGKIEHELWSAKSKKDVLMTAIAPLPIQEAEAIASLEQAILENKELVIETCLENKYQGSINIDQVLSTVISSLGFNVCHVAETLADTERIESIIKNIWADTCQEIAPEAAIAQQTYNDRFANLPLRVKAEIAKLEDLAKVKKGYNADDYKACVRARATLATLRVEPDDQIIIDLLCPQPEPDTEAIANFRAIIESIITEKVAH